MHVVLYISIRFQSCKALFETPCVLISPQTPYGKWDNSVLLSPALRARKSGIAVGRGCDKDMLLHECISDIFFVLCRVSHISKAGFA